MGIPGIRSVSRMNCGPKKTYAFFPEYTSIAQNYYDAGTLNLDFINQPEDSRKTINTWVEDKTNNKIKDLLPMSRKTCPLSYPILRTA